jgi:hypothetical protein
MYSRHDLVCEEATEVGNGVEESHVRASDGWVAHSSKERHLRHKHVGCEHAVGERHQQQRRIVPTEAREAVGDM